MNYEEMQDMIDLVTVNYRSIPLHPWNEYVCMLLF